MAKDETIDGAAAEEQPGRKRKKRWGQVPAQAAPSAPPAAPVVDAADPKAKVLALQESIRARLAAAKKKVGSASAAAATLKRPVEEPPVANQSKRAKHFELDLSQTAPTFEPSTRVATAAPIKKVNPYLAHEESEEVETFKEVGFDPNLTRAAKPRPRHKELTFVEPGFYQEMAETKRQIAQKAQVSGYVSGRKIGHTIHASGWSGEYYSGTADTDQHNDWTTLASRSDANTETNMPLTMEWWDVEMLPSKLKKQVAVQESQVLTKQSKAAATSLHHRADNEESDKDVLNADTVISTLRDACFEQAALSYSKTASLVQHIVPIQPPSYVESTKQPVLHLTKKELKRQRKLRRQAKQREIQDMQAAGLVPAPEPRLTLRNFIQVLGDQAYLDPSQIEQKVTEQMEKRQQAHYEKNQLNKLTKEQRAEKRAKKLQEDTSQGVHVAIFFVKDMSHPYHRAKVDLNAQQSYITGGVLECEIPKMACIICEGGPKAIKRYARLMLVRIKWTGPDDDAADDDEDEVDEPDGEFATQKFNPDNKCELVWQGMAVRRLFKGFVFQECETSDQARKLLKSKGVGHYWDQVLAQAHGKSGRDVQVKLMDDSDEDENPFADKDEDVVMADES